MSIYRTLSRSVSTVSSMVRLNMNTTKLGLGRITMTYPAVQRLSSRDLSCSSLVRSKEWFTITYDIGGGEKHTVQAKDGDNLLDIVINNDVDIDGFGACEGTLACSTCHVIFTDEVGGWVGCGYGSNCCCF